MPTEAAKYDRGIADRLDRDLAPVNSSATCSFLKDDLSLGIVPYRDEGDYVRCEISAGVERISQEAIASAFRRGYPRESLAREVANYIRDVARDVVTYGETSFEVVYSHSSSGQPTSFQVNRTMTDSIRYIFGRPYQLLSSTTILPEVRELYRERIFRIQLPDISARSWRNILQVLADIDKSSLSSRLMLSPGFNFEKQRQIIEVARLKITSAIPWVHRPTLKPNDMSDCYFAYRWLGMQRFKARLRASIVVMINDILSVAGSYIGFRAHLALENLPTVNDIDAAMQALRAGTSGTEIVRQFI